MQAVEFGPWCKSRSRRGEPGDGFVQALKAGRVVMKPGIDRFDGPDVCFTDGTTCVPDVVICATGYRPELAQLVGHVVVLERFGMPPFTGAARHASSPAG